MVQQINFSASPILQNAISSGEVKVFEITPDNNVVINPAVVQDTFTTSEKAHESDSKMLLKSLPALALGTLTALLLLTPLIKNKSEALKGLSGKLSKENTLLQNAKELFVLVANKVESLTSSVRKFFTEKFARIKEATDDLAKKGKDKLDDITKKEDAPKPAEPKTPVKTAEEPAAAAKTAEEVAPVAKEAETVAKEGDIAETVAETATKEA